MPERYQQLVTFEINRILRELKKPTLEESSSVKDGSLYSTSIKKMEENAPEEKKIKNKFLNAFKIGKTAAETRLNTENPRVVKTSNEESTNTLVRKSSIGTLGFDEDENRVVKEYSDNCTIEELVYDTAQATNRTQIKANEWLLKLRNQDILTVGDLRDLHENDWNSLGLTVFASRALKNSLGGHKSPKYGRNVQLTPTSTVNEIEQIDVIKDNID